MSPDGNEEGTFFNPNLSPDDTDGGLQLDNWPRQFTPEEISGFDNGMTRNRSIAFHITPGIRGQFGANDKWKYEVSFNHAQYRPRVTFPEIVISKSNARFLGQQQGVDPATGYAIFNADVRRLHKPLTLGEYGSIAVDALYKPRSWAGTLAGSPNTTGLFQLPAGPVGFAFVAGAGKRGYDVAPDPLTLTNYYATLVDSDGSGSRSRWGLDYEFGVPVLSFLQLGTAGRCESFHIAGNNFGRFTCNIGGGLRPTKRLLFRAACRTGFRAPGLNHVLRGPGNTHPSATDYYLSRVE